MKQFIALSLAAALGAGTAVALDHTARAQDAGRPGMMGERGPGMDRPGMDRPGMREFGGREQHEGMRRPGPWMQRMRQFALIYPTTDRNLSGADVQKIAEAFLLFNGNHSWKVTEVKEAPDQVSFAFATPDGAAIAHFTMDRHTGRPERVD